MILLEKIQYEFNTILTRFDVDVNVDAKPIIRQQWILEQIKKQGKIKSKTLQEQFKISKEIASRDLKKLDKQIKQCGGGNNIWYESK